MHDQDGSHIYRTKGTFFFSVEKTDEKALFRNNEIDFFHYL